MTTAHVRRHTDDALRQQGRRRIESRLVVVAVLAVWAVSGPSGPGFAVRSLDAAGQVLPTISIGDPTVVEGNSGVTTLSYPVTLNAASAQEVRVGYGTVGGVAGGTATGGLTQFVRASPGVLTTIPDVGPASNYPINIAVAGVTGPIEQIDVTLTGVTHTNPTDIDVLLEAPSGEKFVVLSDAGGATPAAKVVVTLKDDATTGLASALTSGVAWPFSGNPPDSFPSPAPSGPYAEAGPAGPGTLNDVFRGINIDPNGNWKLWIVDDTPGHQGSVGNITLTFGVADAATDFVSKFGQIVFPPGTTTRTIDVKVNGDTNVEPNETIFMDLFAPIDAVIGDSQGVGTILDDDGGGGGAPPITVDDEYFVVPGGTLDVAAADGVLKNDTGAVAAVVVDRPVDGVLTFRDDGGFTYRPASGFSGVARFSYRAISASGIVSRVTTVTIFVTSRPGVRPPTAVNDKYVAAAGVNSIVRFADRGVLVNDLENGGGGMTVELVAGPTSGTLTLNPDGGFVYNSPVSMFSESFTYRVTNANGTSNVATVFLRDFFTAQRSLTDFRVRDISGSAGRNRVTARFDPPEGSTPTQYEVQGGILPGQTLATLLTGPYPIAVFDAPSGEFKLRAVPLFGTDRGELSNEIDLRTTTTVAPSAPENLLITVNGSNLDLTWTNTFRGGIPSNVILDVTGDATVSLPLGPVETFSFAGVPSGQYNFTVRSVNASGSSASSNQVPGTFPGACSGPPLTVENFLLYVDGLVLGAIWDISQTGPAPTGYVLNVTSPIFNGPVTVRTTNIRANVPSGVYTMTVTPFNACGSGVATPLQSVVLP